MVYFIQDSVSLDIKIGFTEGPVAERLAALQTGNPHRLVLLAERLGGREEEKMLHTLCKGSRLVGEWFRPTAEVIQAIGWAYVAAESPKPRPPAFWKIDLEEGKEDGSGGEACYFVKTDGETHLPDPHRCMSPGYTLWRVVSIRLIDAEQVNLYEATDSCLHNQRRDKSR